MGGCWTRPNSGVAPERRQGFRLGDASSRLQSSPWLPAKSGRRPVPARCTGLRPKLGCCLMLPVPCQMRPVAFAAPPAVLGPRWPPRLALQLTPGRWLAKTSCRPVACRPMVGTSLSQPTAAPGAGPMALPTWSKTQASFPGA